jgi:hypothetical protein
MGEAPDLWLLWTGDYSEICIELLTLNRRWISGITRLASNCERAAVAAPIVGENGIGIRLIWRWFQAAIRRSALRILTDDPVNREAVAHLFDRYRH